MTPDIKNEIKKYFNASDIRHTDKELSAFATLYNMLIQYNKEYDLSRLHKTEDIIVKHFIDSVFVTQLTSVPSPVVDIGTGPGFPGIPIKIMNPDIEVILAEPRHKRVLFMHKVIDKLQLKKVEVYPHLVTDNSFFETKSVITRALESIDGTLERVNHFLPVDGEVIFMKGPGVKDELTTLSKHSQKYFELIDDIAYTLPHTKYKRHIVKIKKHSNYYRKVYQIMHKTDLQNGQTISSKDNKLYKVLKKSAQGTGFKKTNQIIIPGKKIISEYLTAAPKAYAYLILQDGYIEQDADFNAIIDRANLDNRLLILKKELFNELDVLNTKGPLLAAELPAIADYDTTTQIDRAIMIPFQDPNNVGAVIRSGVALGVTDFILLQEAAHPFNQKAIKASAGTIFKANIYSGPAINQVQNLIQQTPVIALDAGGTAINEFTFPDSFILLPGIEGPGIPENIQTTTVAIPIQNSVESFNAPVAVSIALYEYNRQKRG